MRQLIIGALFIGGGIAVFLFIGQDGQGNGMMVMRLGTKVTAVSAAWIKLKATRRTSTHPTPFDARDVRIEQLPYPRQKENRVLAAITASSTQRIHFIEHQLHAYQHACESGFEIHVVLVTYDEWHDTSIYNHGTWYCHRLGADISVAAEQQQVDGKLSARHRLVFSVLQDRYDYFVSHEDDILVTVEHLLYFSHWIPRFRGTGYHPGVVLYEIPTAWLRQIDWYSVPLIWRPHTAGVPSLGFTAFGRNDLLITVEKPWAPLYAISQEQLFNFTKDTAWLADEDEKWVEFNTHFQHLWLTHHFQIVIPHAFVASALVHHRTNRYTNEGLQQPLQLSGGNGLLVSQLCELTRRCSNSTSPCQSIALSGIAARAFSWAGSCSTCLSSSRSALLRIASSGSAQWNDTGSFVIGEDIVVHVECLERVTYQERSGVVNE